MPKGPSKTKPSTRKLSDVARHVVAPKGAVTTGWTEVEKKSADLGIHFRWWQKPIGRLILAKRADGKYAATIGGTGLSIPRQVGKTFLVGAIVFALCLLKPNLTVIWTAHRLRTAAETFGKMQAFARRARIRPHILTVVRGSGDEAIVFRNGSRILFGARESGFGLGFDQVDVLIFDEAQRLKESTLDDMIPATNQSRQPTGALLLFMGTPPRPTDSGEVFTRMRADALSGEDDDTGWVELGCDPGYVPTPAPAPLTEADWAQIAKANPSFPEDTPREAILRMRKKLGHDSFIREGLGRWDEIRKSYAFGDGAWELCALDTDPGPHVDAFALSVSLDRKHASIGAAGKVEIDDTERLMVAAVDRREGTGWLVPEAWRIHQEYGVPCVVARSAADLIPALEAVGFVAGESLIIARAGDAQDACAQIFDAVQQGNLAHARHQELDDSVYGAHRRSTPEGRWVWDRKNSETDVSMLDAATLALWQAALVTPTYDPLDSIY